MDQKENVFSVLRVALPELRLRWPIRSLAVFGSMARNEAGPSSDLDLLVDFSAPIGLSEFLALEAYLGEITGRNIDLVSRSALKPYIARRVLSEAQPV